MTLSNYMALSDLIVVRLQISYDNSSLIAQYGIYGTAR